MPKTAALSALKSMGEGSGTPAARLNQLDTRRQRRFCPVAGQFGTFGIKLPYDKAIYLELGVAEGDSERHYSDISEWVEKRREALGKDSQAPPLLRQRKLNLTGSPPSRQV